MTQTKNIFKASDIKVSEVTAKWFRFWVEFQKLARKHYHLYSEDEHCEYLPNGTRERIEKLFDELDEELVGAISSVMANGVHAYTDCPDDLM